MMLYYNSSDEVGTYNGISPVFYNDWKRYKNIFKFSFRDARRPSFLCLKKIKKNKKNFF